MPRFTVRVELLETEEGSEQYEDLHAYMEDAGFVRYVVVVDANGQKSRLQLPPAEYSIEDSNLTLGGVKKRAKEAAQKVKGEGDLYRVLVTKSDGPRDWHNLQEYVRADE